MAIGRFLALSTKLHVSFFSLPLPPTVRLKSAYLHTYPSECDILFYQVNDQQVPVRFLLQAVALSDVDEMTDLFFVAFPFCRSS